MSKYNVTVHLTGKYYNTFGVVRAVKKALEQAGASQSDIETFQSEASSNDYDDVLRVAMEWVNVS